MLAIDGTLIVQLVNFLVFLAILNVIFFKPVGAAIARRRTYINGLAQDIESLQHDAKMLRENAEDKRIAARRSVDEVIAAARIEASAEAEKIAVAAAAQAHTIVERAHADVAGEVATAHQAEPALVASLAQVMVERAFASEAA